MQEFLAFRTCGARVAVGGFITQDILDHELSADYQHIAALSSALADRLQGTSPVHITTPLGTNLHLSVTGRAWQTDTGLFRGPGWGNIPAGEVFVAPVEDSAEGALVIDASLPGLALTEPVRIVFEHGRAVSVAGGAGAAYLEQSPCPLGGTMKHENRGADFSPVGKSLLHAVYFQSSYANC